MQNFIGKYVILRTENAGVHCGVLSEYDSTIRHAMLSNARRIYYWEGAFTLSAVSSYGIKDGKISVLLPEIIVNQIIELIPCSEKSEDCLKNFKEYSV